MRTIALVLALPVLVLALGWAAPDDRPTDAERAVEAAVTDYVLGFYEAAPERLERCLSTELKKMGYWLPEEAEEYGGPGHMDYDSALELAARWNDQGQQGEDLSYEVEVYEVLDKIASARVSAKWGIDYFQLVLEGEQWKIHHVLWQTHTPTQ